MSASLSFHHLDHVCIPSPCSSGLNRTRQAFLTLSLFILRLLPQGPERSLLSCTRLTPQRTVSYFALVFVWSWSPFLGRRRGRGARGCLATDGVAAITRRHGVGNGRLRLVVVMVDRRLMLVDAGVGHDGGGAGGWCCDGGGLGGFHCLSLRLGARSGP